MAKGSFSGSPLSRRGSPPPRAAQRGDRHQSPTSAGRHGPPWPGPSIRVMPVVLDDRRARGVPPCGRRCRRLVVFGGAASAPALGAGKLPAWPPPAASWRSRRSSTSALRPVSGNGRPSRSARWASCRLQGVSAPSARLPRRLPGLPAVLPAQVQHPRRRTAPRRRAGLRLEPASAAAAGRSRRSGGRAPKADAAETARRARSWYGSTRSPARPRSSGRCSA